MGYRIAILTCYFGEWPWYFPYFIHSCKFNSTIDFIIFTDALPPQETHIPDNVKIHFRTLEEVRNAASEKLGFPVVIDSPYKVCDFKPAYGFIFPEIFSGYDFWGHGDIDLLYGNIRNFITEEVLNDHDIISVRNEYVTGFFTLFKNTAIPNTLFLRSKDNQFVFQASEYLGFDECGLLCDPLTEGHLLEDLPAAIESMTHVVKALHNKEVIRAYFDSHVVESIPGELQWNNGQLFYKNEYEILLYHLISFKIHPLLQIPDWQEIPDHYFINEFSFSK